MNNPTDPKAPTKGEEPHPTLASRMSDWLKQLSKQRRDDDLHEALAELIEDQTEDERASTPEYHLLNNIVQLKERTVADCMCPRADIIAVEAGMDFQALVKFITREGHSRYPVYRKHLDDVIGMVHLKDILTALVDEKPAAIDTMLRDVLYVPTTMPVMKLMMQMRTRNNNMAIVVDEYGGVDGLITIEDLIEQIVGEIEDEHDETDYAPIQHRSDGTLIIDARMPIEHLEKEWGEFASDAEREENETVNGLIISLVGRVPARGAQVTHPSGMQIDVLDADPRRVRRARLRRPSTAG